jgi:bifunctional UDP-N-acetylglucosamine pyrophosphorylase / glucosamine-1-phosphate N-acetyltransferase
MMQTPVTIVILAAGLGTRMKSRKAKVLHRAGGKALVEHVVDTALELTAPGRIFVVVGHQAEEVKRTIAVPGIGFLEQAEQLGTGHAVKIGRDRLAGLGGYLMVLYGDSPLLRTETLKRLIETEASGGSAAVLMTAIMEDPTGYGRVIRDAHGYVRRVVEQKAGTPEELALREANMGIYCFRSDLFWKHVDEIRPDNPAREFYLTDMAEILTRAGHTVEAMQIEDEREALGINTRVELAAVDRLFRGRKVNELMLAGVTIEKPETVTIDADVTIGVDTVVEPFAQILGRTAIGANCRVGAYSIVENSEIADEAEIGPFTIVRTSRLDRGMHTEPFARLRMEHPVEITGNYDGPSMG